MAIRKVVTVAKWTLIGLVVAVALVWAFVLEQVHYGRPVPAAVPGTVRVACVGDSITFGHPFVADDRYPQQLGEMLGAGYSVRNFGATGYAVQTTADYPYRNHRYFRLSQEFAPNIVFIMLGSNDAKTQNWTSAARFESDYRALVRDYQALESTPRIILLTPPSMFVLKGRTELPYNMKADEIQRVREVVKRFGTDLGLTVLDINAITAPHPEFFTVDGIHPDGHGERLIATATYAALMD